MANDPYELWDAKDLAKHYRVSVATIYKRRMYEPDQIPPALKLGHRVGWIPEAVTKWDLEQLKQQYKKDRDIDGE